MARFDTISCGDITSRFTIPDFAIPERIGNCMEVIAFATRETAIILFDKDDTFSDAEKEAYFALREKPRSTDEGALRQPFTVR